MPPAQANIKTQGSLGSDLGDILAGIEHLKSADGLGFGSRVGIFGGSYGGYMTMRAMAVTNAFQVRRGLASDARTQESENALLSPFPLPGAPLISVMMRSRPAWPCMALCTAAG